MGEDDLRSAKGPFVRADDWLRDPLSRSHSQDLVEVLDDRYGHRSTLVAMQVPMAEWHGRFPDPRLGDAILDRVICYAYRLNVRGVPRRKTDSLSPIPTT